MLCIPPLLPEQQNSYISSDSLETASYDKIYAVFMTRLLVIGGISAVGSITFTAIGATDSGMDSHKAFNAAWGCFGFTLACVIGIKTCRIFSRKLAQIHDLSRKLQHAIEEINMMRPGSFSRAPSFLEQSFIDPMVSVPIWQASTLHECPRSFSFSAPSLLDAISERPSLFLKPNRRADIIPF
ncbi:MAG: hypothetical protein ACRCU0_03490 [Candidatus Rhabdochlamydia sp.]